MSYNPQKKRKISALSDREASVLEQQRLVAARLASGGSKRPSATSSAPKSNSNNKKDPPSSKQAKQLSQSKQSKALSSKLSSNKPSSAKSSTSRSSSTSSSVIRPSIKRPTLKNRQPTSAAAVLAAARSRIQQHPTSLSSSNNPSSSTDSTSNSAPVDLTKAAVVSSSSPQLTRKTKGVPGGALKQFVSASLQTSEQAQPLQTGTYGQISPEDFYRNIRDWDFIGQYAKEKTSSPNQANKRKGKGGDSNKKDDERRSPTPGPLMEKKPLPDTFINGRHYVASWAPLCLAEARAQLLSEVMSKGSNGFAQVTMERPKHRKSSAPVDAMSGNSLDWMLVQCSLPRGSSSRSRSMNFMPNDCALLVPSEYVDVVQMYMRRGFNNMKEEDGSPLSSFPSLRKFGVVGHTEHNRRSLDGLQLKVSKKWWAKLENTKDMSVMKIGCNVTALREFNALCRMESLPLLRNLIGQDLRKSSTLLKRKEDDAKDSKKTSSKTKAQMLHQMGGVNALGKGFTKYATMKFNPSQLHAISAAAEEYGEGGFTLIKGPPGTGKTTTLCAVLNSLHIRQFNKYYEEVRRIAQAVSGAGKVAIGHAARSKPRLLVCAPSNAAVDNVILKIMEDGFVDGSGQRYNPSIIRVGVGQSANVKDVALENHVDKILEENLDIAKLDASIAGYKMELQRIQSDIGRLRRRVHALASASPWPLSRDWEIRVHEENFDTTGQVYFVNHKTKTTTFECPPPPEPGEKQYPATAMPEYRSFIARIVKLVEAYNSVTSKLQRCNIVLSSQNGVSAMEVRMELETHVLDSVHIVMTTLGTAGNRTLANAAKFEVVVVDEAAQSVEPSTLSALQLGSKHAILVGDPQQLPATIFNVSGRNTKYDRSLFQRLEEAGHTVHMLNQQYRMHPAISHFPRKIFYGGNLLDGPNVLKPDYGNPLRQVLLQRVPAFSPFTILDLDSKEERGGTSLANSQEAHLACHLYTQMQQLTNGLSSKSRVAVITPYSQQAGLIRRCFQDLLGPQYGNFVEVNTVDAFQGREAKIVIFSAVRALGSHGIGFLSDVRRMNVALTRAKHFLLVIARCESIVVNPYWRDLVKHARETNAVVRVPMLGSRGYDKKPSFPDLQQLQTERPKAIPGVPPPPPPPPPGGPIDPRKAAATAPTKATDPRRRSAAQASKKTATDPRQSAAQPRPKPVDPRRQSSPPRATDPRRSLVGNSRPADPRKG